MIRITDISLKNFMSIGNVEQNVKFNEGLTLVLGNNLDLGGDGARNGVGKTTLINGLSYALYGGAINSIKKNNLINLTNNKDMVVSLNFEKDGTKYKVIRGRKPNIFKLFVNDHEFSGADDDNEAQGENRQTQAYLEKIFGMTHSLFKHIVTLNTYTTAFLSLGASEQRAIIEQLLGITLLSEKAENLKEQQRITKDAIREEEFSIKAIKDSNQRIEKSISDLERRQRLWSSKKSDDIQELKSQIEILEKIDIDDEIQLHIKLDEYSLHKNQLSVLTNESRKLVNNISREKSRLETLNSELRTTEEHKCYACGQHVHDETHTEMLEKIRNSVKESEDIIEQDSKTLTEIDGAISQLGELGDEPRTYYHTRDEAYDHQSRLDSLRSKMLSREQEEDTYQEQIESLKKEAIQEISWDKINDLSKLKDHQDFLYKLLTNKDSFVRKKIIDQNLQYLNNRLAYYLTKLGLPHEIQFQSDLEVEITELGRALDFDNLSRGERNRLILGLSWAFRDVFENMNSPINIIAIDEMMDSGMDSVGTAAALNILKSMERERGKNIILVSHKEELQGRVNSILHVTKENGFTTFALQKAETPENYEEYQQ